MKDIFDPCFYPIIIIIWSKMAQLELEESSEVKISEGPNRLKLKLMFV